MRDADVIIGKSQNLSIQSKKNCNAQKPIITMSSSTSSSIAALLVTCFAYANIISCSHGFSMIPTSRRVALEKLTITPFLTTFLPSPQDVAIAVTDDNNDDSSPSSSVSLPKTSPISAQWNAVDGLNSLESEKKFVTFDKSAYQAMMNDQSRTPLFEQAIVNRLTSPNYEPNSQIVLDLGTGPFALFAVIAAKNGAKHVYAIEASKEAAASARETVRKLGYDDKITILEGFSTDIFDRYYITREGRLCRCGNCRIGSNRGGGVCYHI